MSSNREDYCFSQSQYEAPEAVEVPQAVIIINDDEVELENKEKKKKKEESWKIRVK